MRELSLAGQLIVDGRGNQNGLRLAIDSKDLGFTGPVETFEVSEAFKRKSVRDWVCLDAII